jgi:hypothetical protein
VTTPNGTSNGTGSGVRLAGPRPMILVRYRPGHTGETARAVHLAPLPDGGQPNALCGRLLLPQDAGGGAAGDSYSR